MARTNFVLAFFESFRKSYEGLYSVPTISSCFYSSLWIISISWKYWWCDSENYVNSTLEIYLYDQTWDFFVNVRIEFLILCIRCYKLHTINIHHEFNSHVSRGIIFWALKVHWSQILYLFQNRFTSFYVCFEKYTCFLHYNLIKIISLLNYSHFWHTEMLSLSLIWEVILVIFIKKLTGQIGRKMKQYFSVK